MFNTSMERILPFLLLLIAICNGNTQRKRLLALNDTLSGQDLLLKLQDLTTQVMDLKDDLENQRTENKQLKDQIAQMNQAQAQLSSHITEVSDGCCHASAGSSGTTGSKGSTYIRWGRTSCNNVTSQLVYDGYAAGNYFSSLGSGSNILCLPSQPSFDGYHDGLDPHTAQIWGAEFEMDIPEILSPSKYHNEDVGCSVCQLSNGQRNVLMIPAQTQCPLGWTKEYQGYLMANNQILKSQSNYICVDKTPDIFQGGSLDLNGLLLYPVEARCGILPCLPYVEGRELACVVCSN